MEIADGEWNKHDAAARDKRPAPVVDTDPTRRNAGKLGCDGQVSRVRRELESPLKNESCRVIFLLKDSLDGRA